MFWRPEIYRHDEFSQGLRDFAPQAAGVGAWGLMTGVAMMNSGLSLTESLAMALLVFAGSSQLASMPLILAGAPWWVILATGFCVNLRFVVFSLHLRSYLMHLPRWRRLLHGYFTADIGYVLFVKRHPKPAQDDAHRLGQEAYLMGGNVLNWGSWLGASVVGVLLSNFIPPEWGLGFAGILCLLGILCSLATSRMRGVSALVAGLVGVLAYSLPLKLNIVLAIAVAVAVCMMLESAPPASPSVSRESPR
jgi:predicted branched-subunit amino acid permease